MSNVSREGAIESGGSGAAIARTGVAIIAFTRRGCELALRIADGLREGALPVGEPNGPVTVHGPERFASEFGIGAYESLAAWTADVWTHVAALVYVGASGIAVRGIAPHVRDKLSDPAVASIDEAGRFCVPLLSGHVGGANELARSIALLVGATAVVSTATDVNGLFAVDEWAARRGLRIVERTVAREISARLLEGGTVGFANAFPCEWDVPEEIANVGTDAQIGFAITFDEDWRPFKYTLHLVPNAARVGVGCRRGTDPGVLSHAVDAALLRAGVPSSAVGTLASIDVKENEPAIAVLASARGWDLQFYTAEELNAVPGEFASSEFVRRTVGVDNVCERAALIAGGRLLVGKQAGDGVTVAVAIPGATKGAAPLAAM